MPIVERGRSSIYYEVHGDGFPILLLAPGGLDSTIGMWERAAINPLDVLGDEYRLVAMDQCNAGRSSGPLEDDDPWGAYVDDQLAVADAVDASTFHVMGCCIGCSYALKLIERAPERIISAVLEQPIGILADNRDGWTTRQREWTDRLRRERADIDEDTATRFGSAMWEHDFVAAVSREFVSTITTPLAVLPGVDEIHPRVTGLEIAELAPRAELIDPWRDDPEVVARATEAIRSFLARHASS